MVKDPQYAGIIFLIIMNNQKHTPEELVNDLQILQIALICLASPEQRVKIEKTRHQIAEIREDAKQQKRKTPIIFTTKSDHLTEQADVSKHWLEFIE